MSSGEGAATVFVEKKGGEDYMDIKCKSCREDRWHYHIIVEQGKVTEVYALAPHSAEDYDLPQSEYFVEYRDSPVHNASAGDRPQSRTAEIADWLEPLVSKGSGEEPASS